MQNVGSLDRLVRLVAGVVLLVVGLAPLAGYPIVGGLGGWAYVVAIVGAVLIFTGLVRTCPAYLPFGINTNRRA